VILVLGIGSLLLLFSCEEEIEKEHYEVPTFYLDTEISTSDGSTMKIEDAAAFLATLTNEDGTGEINLNMTWQEIAAVLDEKGVLYEVMGISSEDPENPYDWRSIFTEDCTDYSPASGRYKFHQSKKGLKVGEPITKAIEIYGEPDKIVIDSWYDNVKEYYYNMGKLYRKTTGNEETVILHLSIGDETVVTIRIKFLDQTNYLDENLEETFWG